MKTVLCIFTYRLVLVLDMDEILRDEDRGGATSPAPPPLMRILDFVASGLPLGMGFLKSGNFLYMFGGEYYDDRNYEMDINWTRRMKESYPRERLDYFPNVPMVNGAGLPEKDPPCPVYRLDLTDDRSKPVKLQPMLGPKLYAVVKEIGGLIYILSTKLVSCSRPMFEVWDPKTEKSRALPNPPLFSRSPDVINCDAFGRDIIYVMLNGDIKRFNTASETWECVEDLPPRESMAMSGKFDVRNRDVCITFGKDESLLAIMDGPDGKDGRPVELMFDRSEYEPEIPGFKPFGDVVTLVDTSEQGEYMCGLMPYQSDNVYCFALYVFVFQLEKHGSKLAVRYLKRQFYDFTHIKCIDDVSFLDFLTAVIGRVLPNKSAGMDKKLLCRSEGKGKKRKGRGKRKQ